MIRKHHRGFPDGPGRGGGSLGRASLKPPPHSMSRPAFVERFGSVYEHSPWIAEAVFDGGRLQNCASAEGLHAAMRGVVEAAPGDTQLALLRAHPDLAGRLALRGELTVRSAEEQAGAGLDKCNPGEFARFCRLNDAYKAKFGFPFIIAVKGLTRRQILAAFERRLASNAAAEFRTALDEVHKIARFRLSDL